MDARIASVDDGQRAPKTPFKPREFRRLLGLVRPHLRLLIIGLAATILFAALHTVSIGAAFPVFKILLEEEGLHGWVNRCVSGKRLGVEFAPIVGDGAAQLVRIHDRGPLAGTAKPGDRVSSPASPSGIRLLEALASAAPGSTFPLRFESPIANREAMVVLPPNHWAMRWLLGITGFIPLDAAEQKLRALACVLAAVVVIAVTANLFRYIGEVMIAKSILLAMMDLRARLYERTLRLPLVYFSGRQTSDIVTRFVQDIQEIQRGLITLFGKFIREPLRAALILGWAFTLDWRITLTATVASPFAVAVFWWVGRAVKTANRKLLQAYGTMIGALTTTLHNLRVVKAYTAESIEEDRLEQVDHGMFRQQLKLAKLDAFVSPFMETVAVLAGSIVTIWLLSRVLNHELSISKFVTLGLTLSILFDPLRKLSDVYVRVQRSTAGAERIFQVIDHPVEFDCAADRGATEKDRSPGSASAGVSAMPLQQGVEIVDVTFTYPGAGGPALSRANLRIAAGETIALVGPNGCGKTTLVSMLPRLLEPDEGRVLYDGVDVRELDLTSLRRRIGMVSQEAVVFGGTPTENIIYGAEPGAAAENGRLEDAARRAYADEFIRAIPGGYQASLGERGTTLSGGQRQRLAIARAIFRNAPILIFDEATSQIDSESEMKIQNALREFSRGRTTIIIAHRLSTILFADRVIVMENGRILDQGKHAELLPRCALYRTLCETQFGAGSSTT